MDTLFVSGLATDAIIGIHPHERSTRQPIILDLELGVDTRPASSSDDIAVALDYDALSQAVLDFVDASDFQLIETLAEHIATLVLEHFPVQRLRLTLHKPKALERAQDVGVIIERQR